MAAEPALPASLELPEAVREAGGRLLLGAQGCVTAVVSVASERLQPVERGRCRPFPVDADERLADGRRVQVERVPPTILAGNEVIADEAELEELAAGPRPRVTAIAARGERIVAALGDGVLVHPAVVLVFHRGQLEERIPLPDGSFPSVVGLAPDASAIWYHDASDGRDRVVLLADGRLVELEGVRSFAWSPDGSLLAAATAGGVAVLRWPGGERLTTIDVTAGTVEWNAFPADVGAAEPDA